MSKGKNANSFERITRILELNAKVAHFRSTAAKAEQEQHSSKLKLFEQSRSDAHTRHINRGTIGTLIKNSNVFAGVNSKALEQGEYQQKHLQNQSEQAEKVWQQARRKSDLATDKLELKRQHEFREKEKKLAEINPQPSRNSLLD